jgi:hypothetical protein
MISTDLEAMAYVLSGTEMALQSGLVVADFHHLGTKRNGQRGWPSSYYHARASLFGPRKVIEE